METQFGGLEARFGGLEARFDGLEARFDSRMAALDREVATLRMEIEASSNKLRLELATQRADTVKWLFLFWLGTVAANVAVRLF